MTPRQQLDGFLAKYDPAIARTAKAVLAAMRRRLPGAIELVYDNYNALAIGFATGDRVKDVVFSVAVYPRWVTLFFYKDGARLPDPHGVLRGKGAQVRHVVLDDGAATLDRPPIRELIHVALDRHGWTPTPGARGSIVIKSVAPKQRPRRAAPAARAAPARQRKVKARVKVPRTAPASS
jgi:hypothetical protein